MRLKQLIYILAPDSIVKWLRKRRWHEYLSRWLRKPGIKILDVGCGENSPSLTKYFYPECRYFGLDKNRSYNLNNEDFRCMEGFYEIDLLHTEDLNIIPDDYFDCIILSHIIEHLENSETVIKIMLNKLKRKGIMYVEFPSPHSVHLPRMKYTLNFYDDPTHVKLHNLKELRLLFKENGCAVLKSGIGHSFKRIVFLPLYALVSLITLGCIAGVVFWDITGFASYVIVRKTN